MIFNFLTNTASVLAITSNAVEAGKMGLKNASQSARSASAIKDIKDYTGDSVLNKASEKHDAMKEIARSIDVKRPFNKTGGAVSGFCKGFWEGMKGNWLSTGFAAMTLASKNKIPKTIGTAGMTISLIYDFIKNGTSLFTRKNIIEK